MFGVEVARQPYFRGSSAQPTVTIEITHVPQKTMSTPHDRKELAEIRKESLDICNRIHSIAEDALFVQKVAEHYCEYPVIRAVDFLSYAGPNLNEDPQQT